MQRDQDIFKVGVSVRSYTSELHNAYGLIAPLAWFSSLLRDKGGRNDMTAICRVMSV